MQGGVEKCPNSSIFHSRRNRRGLAANIVLHDGNHRQRNGNREPSVTAAGLLIAKYKPTHRFVTLDAWA